jgi:hypothetical protein
MKKNGKNNPLWKNNLGKSLLKFSVKEQFEISLISLLGLILALLVTSIYLVFFSDMSTFMRVMMIVNGLFGISFLASFMATTYQQYINFISVSQAMNDMTSIFSVTENKMKGGTEQ